MAEGGLVKHNRPAAVLVMAILNLVFGGLGLVCYLCAGAGAAFVVSMLNKVPSQQTASSPLSQGVGSIVGLVLGIAYSIALLIVMFHPTVTAAFAGERAGLAGDDLGYREDERDRYDGDDDEEDGGDDKHKYGYRPRRPDGRDG